MKLLTPTEIKQTSESERTKDLARLESVKSALKTAQQQLNEADAKFEVALANQQKRWLKEEQEATSRITILQDEIKDLEQKKAVLLIPIYDEKDKAHNLFTEAEKVLEDARNKSIEVDNKRLKVEELSDILQRRLDEVGDHETSLNEREQKLLIREDAVFAEREQIKRLSKELSINLTTLHG